MQETTNLSGPRPEPGVLLGDRYRLERCIAVGGMGEVWEASDRVLGRAVAIKILKDEFVDSPEFIARFRNEARHTASLSHPGIANVFDYGENSRYAYLVMELVHGEALSHRLARQPPLTTAAALSILAQTAEALHAAHLHGVVHRDVKPGNLMLLDDGSVKVTDFGIARAVDAVPITAVGQVVGTARYMSPEQALGQPARASSDVYSLGVIGFEMLAGQPPFVADSPIALARAHVHDEPPTLPATVPAGVRAMITRSLSKSPEHRQPSAEDFASEAREELRAVSSPSPTAVRAETAATQVLDANAAAPTRRMPTGGVRVSAPVLLIDKRALARRRPITLIAALIALAAVVALTVLALRDRGVPVDQTTVTTVAPTVPATAAAAATTPPASVNVDPATLVGFPAADAQTLLEAMGLTVRTQEAESDAPQGTVTSVQPAGAVPAGSEITLTVSSGDGKDKKKGHGGSGGD